MSTDDGIESFLSNAGSMVQDAQFIVDSMPNVELFSVERALRHLSAIHFVLANIEGGQLSPERIEELIAVLLAIQVPLERFRDAPPPPRNIGTKTIAGSGAGRPRYVLDLLRACELHDLGNSWESIGEALGVTRQTLYNHLRNAGLSTARRPYTDITDDDLDELVAAISLSHPFAGSAVVLGHLESRGVHVPRERVQDSLWRVDGIGVIVRWKGVIKRRVYRVRGSNALWHMDGNEKLRPWGFYVHGCVDGHSRLIIYLHCINNKRSKTVEAYWLKAVADFGWPSRGRGDFGTENNGVERVMIAHWGIPHRAFLRGRSTQNIRMERCWRDVRKDTLEVFRQIFAYLQENGLLDMENPVHRLCLYLVFQPRIQHSLDETRHSWNLHKIRTAGNKTPTAIYELSKTRAINRGYWPSDPGDDVPTASASGYGEDAEEQLPPADELAEDPTAGRPDVSEEEEHAAGIFVNEDEEIAAAREILADFDTQDDDGNSGIDVYCRAVLVFAARVNVEV